MEVGPAWSITLASDRHGGRSVRKRCWLPFGAEAIDTTTAGGRLVFHLFGALGHFERDLILERTRVGLQAADARGRKGGR